MRKPDRQATMLQKALRGIFGRAPLSTSWENSMEIPEMEIHGFPEMETHRHIHGVFFQSLCEHYYFAM